VTENKVLRRIFGPKRDEVTGGWRKLHNEVPHNLQYLPRIIRTINQVKEREMDRGGFLCEIQKERYISKT
jgi:hypothetical protein